MKFILLFLILNFIFSEIVQAQNKKVDQPKLIAEWVSLDFDWVGMGENQTQWIENAQYIPNNCALTGIKQFKDRIFLTVPVCLNRFL